MSITILGQSEPPGRRPPDTRTLRHRSTALLRYSFSVRFRRLFLPLSRFPKPSASASRLPNTGTSLATLLSFANAVVTRRRVQVYTLPLSAPGSLSAPWPPTIPAPGSHSSRNIPGCSTSVNPRLPQEPFQPGSGGNFGTGFHQAVPCRRASVSRLPGLFYGPIHTRHAGVTQRCTQVWHNP